MTVSRVVRLGVLAVAGLLIAAIGTGLLLLDSRWGEERVRRLIVDRATAALRGELSIERLGGSLTGGDVQLEGVRLRQDGIDVFAADEVRLRYRLTAVFSDLTIADVVLVHPRIALVQDESTGVWNVTRLTVDRGQPSSRPTFSIDRLQIADGTVSVQPAGRPARAFDTVNLTLGLDVDAAHVGVDLREASLRDAGTGLPVRRLEADTDIRDGHIAIDDLQLATDRSRLAGTMSIEAADGASDARRPVGFDLAGEVALADVAPYVEAVASRPDGTVTIDVAGTLARFEGDWSLASEAGGGRGHVAATLAGDRLHASGDVATDAWDLAAWTLQSSAVGRVSVTGRYEADIPLDDVPASTIAFAARVPAVTVEGYRLAAVDVTGNWRAGRVDGRGTARAYGATFNGRGHWNGDDRTYGAEGRFTGLDATALPDRLAVPALSSDLAGRVTVAGGPGRWSVDAVLTPSTVEGATLDEGFTAHAESGAEGLRYTAAGTIRSLDPSRLTILFDDPPPLLTRAAGSIDATVTVDGQGTDVDEGRLVTTARVATADVAGITLADADVTATLAGGGLDIELMSDDVTVAGDPLGFETGPLDVRGGVDARARMPDLSSIDLATVDAEASVTLRSSRVRDTALDRAVFAGAMAGGRITVRQLHVQGPDLSLDASGPVVVAGSGESDLTFTAGVTDLSALEAFVDQTLSGGLTLAGRVTGPADRPSATGTLSAHQVAAGPVEALTVSGTFDGTLPDRDPDRAVASVDVSGTFVEISGTALDEVRTTVSWDAGRIDVDATLAQGARSVDLEGTVVPRDDFRELQLRRLDVGDGTVNWSLASGDSAVVQYAASRLSVQRFRLVSGDASIVADGVLGEGATAPLHVTATGVSVEDLNRLALGTYDVQGTLSADVDVTGTVDLPVVAATLTVAEGSVEGQAFRRVEATANLRDSRIDVDLSLEADSLGTFSARGVVPYRPSASWPDAPPYDLRITGTALELGFFDPFVPGLETLHGRSTINLLVTGPSASPELNGTIAVVDGGFDVPSTGVTYDGLQADMVVAGRQLTVNRFRMEDEDGHPIVIDGALNVPGLGEDAAVDLVMQATNVKVLDNEFGEMALTSNLQLLGSLQVPLVSGTVTITRGVVEVSDLLDRLAATGYQPVSTGAAEAANQETPYAKSSFSVTLAIPDNLVVRGRDLRSGSGPIGLGDVNVTLGGALSMAKNGGEEPAIFGRVNVVRGRYQFQGRPFTIVRGSTLRFQGEPSNPLLDVTAERAISGVTARVQLGGTLASPTVQLSSNPPLDQGDVLSLIVFNQTMNQLPGSQRVSLAARAGSLAAGAIATPIADSVARALDLDVFEIQPTTTGGGGASVRIGRQVSDRLFLGFSQDFGRDEVSQVSFEYRLNDVLSILTSWSYGSGTTTGRLQAEQAGIDLIFTVR